MNLRTAVKYPTPQASDYRNRGNIDTPAIARRVKKGKQITLTMTVSGGQLNPDWVEWLMNWPIKWSEANAIDIENFKRWQEESATALPDSDGVRIMWWNRDPSTTPQGPRHFQQQSGKHCDALQQMPRQDARGSAVERAHETADVHELREAIHIQTSQGNNVQQIMRKQGGMVIAEIVPRVTHKTPNRVDRLKAIGNGQVPSVAALAWRILSEGMES